MTAGFVRDLHHLPTFVGIAKDDVNILRTELITALTTRVNLPSGEILEFRHCPFTNSIYRRGEIFLDTLPLLDLEQSVVILLHPIYEHNGWRNDPELEIGIHGLIRFLTVTPKT